MSTVADSLREGFAMLWQTLWALVLGFTLSGLVQSFVSRERMEAALGDHHPRTIVKSSLWGAASSSCSYAASALARSLFERGADFTAAMVFMFASTNLVVELGIVLWLLMGWQFALAELVGGVIMIALFAAVAPRIFPAAELAQARERLSTDAHRQDHHGGAEPGLRQKLVTAAGFTISDLTMLRRELVVGFVAAGFVAVAVPTSVFTTLLVTGHGPWTDLENALVAPLVAVVSFVCSIGNVPLAAALWSGGVTFGGTVAFLFADLIALPLIVIYAGFYGRRLALRLVVGFWSVMSLAGLAVDALFRVVDVPLPAHPRQVASTHLGWDHTTVLDLLALVVLGVVWGASRQRRDSPQEHHAKDPICGMQVERAHPGATAVHDGETVFFCSGRCRDRFRARQPA